VSPVEHVCLISPLNINLGPWTKEEEEELTRIVMELTVERGLQADNDVLWSEVSERMGGRRTRQQVRIKWYEFIVCAAVPSLTRVQDRRSQQASQKRW
jgi:hypothetical protein